MTCPDCGEPLAEQTIASHYDAPIPVDQCAACGGTWCDGLELYMTATQALVATGTRGKAAVHPAGPHEGVARASLRCPRCRLPLRRSAPYGASADVWLHDCTICGGAWVRPADLVRFGQQREQRTVRGAHPAAPRPD